MKFSKKVLFKSLSIALASSGLLLTACGGSGGGTSEKLKEEADRIEDQVSDISDDLKDDYDELEDKLSKKSMSEIIESIFLPENSEEKFDEFLDKLTPKGGKGGLYVGHFVETDDGDNGDLDIGAIYFDIPQDFGGSIDGRVSYQQKACQANRTLATDTAVKIDEAITGKLSGSLDTLEFIDIKYIRDLDIETPNILTTFAGKFDKDSDGKPWSGSFEYQDGLGGTELSSGEDNCDVTYTLGGQSDYTTYPLNYALGELNINISGTGSRTMINWTNPANTSLVLVSQVNVNDAESGANGFERNQVFKNAETSATPVMTDTPTNYAFVVQAFDSQNKLIGYDALVIDLPMSIN